MVEEANVEERERVLEPAGQDLIRAARLGLAARVVVKDDDRRRVEGERPLRDDPRVDLRTIDRAGEDSSQAMIRCWLSR